MLDRSTDSKIRSTFLVAISLSIGWGIRGNFGHESGAMIAGVLSALAVVIVSGREAWWHRAPYFALLGGLGWGFGGSIAYMYPFSFTESGHAASTYYGYLAVLLEGGLWCGLGVGGMAMAAVMPMERLKRFCLPLVFVLLALGARYWIEEPLERWLAAPGAGTGDERWHRHESPLYWFDADWLPALLAVVGVCLFDLWDRTRDVYRRSVERPYFVIVFIALGALVGFLGQNLLHVTGIGRHPAQCASRSTR